MHSEHFSEQELACPCCGKNLASKLLLDALEESRGLAGCPIIVNSGYRCDAYNRKISGVPNSTHIRGLAADIVIPGLSVREMYELANLVERFTLGGIGVYPDNGFIHVDARDFRARWCKTETGFIPFVEWVRGSCK